jgi:hypothetical protein
VLLFVSISPIACGTWQIGKDSPLGFPKIDVFAETTKTLKNMQPILKWKKF